MTILRLPQGLLPPSQLILAVFLSPRPLAPPPHKALPRPGVCSNSAASRLFSCPRLRLPTPLTFLNADKQPHWGLGKRGDPQIPRTGWGLLGHPVQWRLHWRPPPGRTLLQQQTRPRPFPTPRSAPFPAGPARVRSTPILGSPGGDARHSPQHPALL